MPVHEIDVETPGKRPNRRPETRAPQAGHTRQRLQGGDVVQLEPLPLLGARIPAIADDMHLVPELDEPPTPADDVERAQICDTQET